MPLQNRVDPFGGLHAVAARGALMGNRGGRFHDDAQKLGARRHVSRRWIICVCEFRGRRREVWGAGYTELFFLDEPTALAAGHRPCFECRRADALRFAEAFGAKDADAIDRRLDVERRIGRDKRMHRMSVDDLPDGAMFARDGEAFTIRSGELLQWDFAGYTARGAPPAEGEVDVLTPPSTCAALSRGYAPLWG
jgi:hypothetical protein